MLYIIRSVKKTGNDIVVVSLSDNNNDDSRFYDVGVQIVHCVISLSDILTNRLNKLYEIIQSHSPDIVQTYGIRPDTALKSRRIKSILVTTIRCSIKQCYYADYGKIAGFLATRFHESRIKDGRTIVACSDAVSDYNKNELQLSTYAVVRNGIETDYKRLSIKEKETKRNSLGFSKADIVVVSTGYLTKAKDPLLIADGIRIINSTLKDTTVKVVFLGEGPLRERIESYNDKNIILAGHVSNVSEWLDIADVYASASHFEGMPNAVLEGMRSSLPLILSDIPSHVEIINNTNKYIGELFRVTDLQSFVEAFRKLIEHDIYKAGLAAREIIVSDYSVDRLGEQYLSIYKELMKDACK